MIPSCLKDFVSCLSAASCYLFYNFRHNVYLLVIPWSWLQCRVKDFPCIYVQCCDLSVDRVWVCRFLMWFRHVGDFFKSGFKVYWLSASLIKYCVCRLSSNSNHFNNYEQGNLVVPLSLRFCIVLYRILLDRLYFVGILLVSRLLNSYCFNV